MPDVEFFVNLGDWPLEKKKSNLHIHPIFSWCGSTDSKDIVMPTYDLTDSELELGMEIQIRDQFEVAIKIVELVEVARLEHRSPKTEPWGVAAVHEKKREYIPIETRK